MIVTRFAPSPTGLLHVGHAYAAFFAWHPARQTQGRFLLRIEDIDRTRCRREFATAIEDDLTWLGLDWDGEIRRQSEHMPEYAEALNRLTQVGLIYPCFCSRKDIAAAASAPHGRSSNLYPGTCRNLAPEFAADRMAAGDPYALRLDSSKAQAFAGEIDFFDRDRGLIVVDAAQCGDVVLGRRDAPASYHLCVAVDDAAQGVSLVTRGEDLLEATHVQRLIQAALGLEAPEYWHHRLLTNAAGRRLSKRDQALSIRSLRDSGQSAAAVRAMAGIPG